VGTWFDITAAQTTIALDAGRRADAVFTVSNATDAPIRGLALARPAPGADPTWFTVDRPEREWAVGGSDQVAVSVQVPPDAPGGVRSFQLRVVMTGGVPEEDFDDGPTVAFEVPPPPPPPVERRPFPWWIVAVVAVVVLALVAGGVFLATRPSPTPTPVPTAEPTPTPPPTPTPALPNLVIAPDIAVFQSIEDIQFGRRPVVFTEVIATIRNSGQGPAGPFTVRATIRSQSATEQVGELAAGESTSVSLTIITSSRRGTLVVDPGGAVSETNEGDNQRSFD
jgi:hypothetical protein